MEGNEQYEDEDKAAQQELKEPDVCGMCGLVISEDVGNGARANCKGCCKHIDGSQKLCPNCDLCDCECHTTAIDQVELVHEDLTDDRFVCPQCKSRDRYFVKRAPCHPHLTCYKYYCKTCKFKQIKCVKTNPPNNGDTSKDAGEGTLRSDSTPTQMDK